MAPGVLQQVRKRDGRLVPFDAGRIRAALDTALASAGESDPGFASEVAHVVELTLAERARAAAPAGVPRSRDGRLELEPQYVPRTEEIQDLAERALMELGRAGAARAMILYRERRARIRDALSVHRDDAARGSLRVRESEGVSAW